MKKYMKILKNDGSSLSLGPTVVTIGNFYEVRDANNIYHITIPDMYPSWSVSKSQEGEYYVIVGDYQSIPLIGV